MPVTLELSTEQERLLRESTVSADATVMRRVLLEAIDATIERLLRLSARSKPVSDFEALADSLATKFGATAAPDQRLHPAARPTLKELLLADSPRAEIPVPSRQRWRRRPPEVFG